MYSRQKLFNRATLAERRIHETAAGSGGQHVPWNEKKVQSPTIQSGKKLVLSGYPQKHILAQLVVVPRIRLHN